MSSEGGRAMLSNIKPAVVGLGYVGLPLATLLASRYQVIGFDISKDRVAQLRLGNDATSEVSAAQLAACRSRLSFTSKVDELGEANFYIITVPTPVSATKQPDMSAVEEAFKLVSQVIGKGDFLVLESTVYPGATEAISRKILEEGCGITKNQDFYLGYSPERINPGDKERGPEAIVKVVSGSSAAATSKIADLYGSVIKAGIHIAPSIAVAEAAKVIENIQRDINIALMNDLAVFADKAKISVWDILAASKSKWNFLPFEPGLVGGHCIGVDPYYLTYRAAEVGHDPRFILAGRDVNEGFVEWLCEKISDWCDGAGTPLGNAKVLLLGCTFKENCPDVRNSKALLLRELLEKAGAHVDCFDPLVTDQRLRGGLSLLSSVSVPLKKYNAIILAVPHDEFFQPQYLNLDELIEQTGFIFDLKNRFPHLKKRKLL